MAGASGIILSGLALQGVGVAISKQLGRILGALAAGLIAGLLLWIRKPALSPALLIVLGGALLVAAIVAAWWFWRARARLADHVEQLIDAAERISRGEFSQ